MVLQALKNAVILGLGLWLLLILLVLLMTGGQGDPMDVHKPRLSEQLLGLVISAGASVLLFTVIGLISVGLMKTYEFVKRTLGFS